ncbi:MAG: PD-(D/E)XK nuclease family protein [Fimbriimonadales bacterium]|nr:PD-(D/E)XK nuclease family protein [Fimbriimonadales bacterium]GBC90509.1 hypothetical protein HRbin14_01246 [bacterium HR14]
MRKPSLSPTKITTYLTCRVKYYWAYLTPYGKWMKRPNAALSLGANLHRVLQAFHELGGAETLSEAQTRTLLEQLWSHEGFATPHESEQHKQLGETLLQNYYQTQAEQPSEARLLFTERLLRKDMGEFVLIGRIDRVDEYPDGTLEIIDYKSGRKQLTPEQVQGDVALHCYALLLRELYPERPLRIAIYALQIGEKLSLPVEQDTLDEFATLIHDLGVQILTEDYSAIVPEPFEACEGCEFLELCQRHFWRDRMG